MTHRILRPLLGIAFVAWAATSAQALPITLQFSGVVDSVSGGLTGFSVGDLLTGSYVFESTTAARSGSNATFAVYDAVSSLTFSAGSYTAATAPGFPRGEIQVDDNPPSPFVDRYGLISRSTDGLTGAAVNGFNLSAFGFRLDDVTNTAFSTALILPNVVNLSSFSSSSFFIFFGNQLVSGRLTAIGAPSVVPEPATLGLTALGLAALARRARKRYSTAR